MIILFLNDKLRVIKRPNPEPITQYSTVPVRIYTTAPVIDTNYGMTFVRPDGYKAVERSMSFIGVHEIDGIEYNALQTDITPYHTNVIPGVSDTGMGYLSITARFSEEGAPETMLSSSVIKITINRSQEPEVEEIEDTELNNILTRLTTVEFYLQDLIGTGDLIQLDKINWNMNVDADEDIPIGSTRFNSRKGTIETRVPGGSYIEHGQKLQFLGTNATPNVIPKGTLVAINETILTTSGMYLTLYDPETQPAAVGITVDDIFPSQKGYFAMSGLVEGINTQYLGAGSKVYGSESGGLTSTRTPRLVGVVVRQDSMDGAILISLSTGSGVSWDTSNIEDGQIMVWSANDNEFKPAHQRRFDITTDEPQNPQPGDFWFNIN